MSAHFKFTYAPYERPFMRSIDLYGHVWKVRTGILLDLSDVQGRSARAEIAPIEQMGTESLLGALRACERLKGNFSREDLQSLQTTYPATASGFYLGIQALGAQRIEPMQASQVAHLLDLSDPIASLIAAQKKGHCVFKMKIARGSCPIEIGIYHEVAQRLKPGQKLRLDANGRLSARDFLSWCDAVDPAKVEFLEQPFMEMKTLVRAQEDAGFSIAVDESLSTWENCRRVIDLPWTGLYVIKPALMGDLPSFMRWQSENAQGIVYSSSFETQVGLDAIVRLARKEPIYRALGIGTQEFFGAVRNS